MRRVWMVVVAVVLLVGLGACSADLRDEAGGADSGHGGDAADVGGIADTGATADTGGTDGARDTDDVAGSANALYIYDDNLKSPWIDASWDAVADFGAASHVFAGTQAIAVVQQDQGALSFLNGDWGQTQDIDPAAYDEFEFVVYSAQALELDVLVEGDGTYERISVGPVAAGEWTTVAVALSELSPNGDAFDRVDILESSGSTVTYYVDEVRLTGGHTGGGADAGPSGDTGDAGGTDAPDASGPDAGDLPQSAFVSVDPNNPRFIVDGEPFYFVGTNLYWMIHRYVYNEVNVIDDAFDMCEAMGLRVIRMWGFADGDDWTTSNDPGIMQPEPGVYNESTFEALDYILAEAEAHGVRVIIPFVNYWEAYGGMLQYARWAGGNSYEYFYTEMAARQLYKNYLDKVVNRVNTITGEVYREDPTIMAWELANEANAHFDSNAANGTLETWYAEMAAYLRSLDPNHMIATGEEGFGVSTYADRYSPNYSNDYVIRGSAGTSYVDNTALADISYGGAHLYPDAWGLSEPVEDGRRWITDHAAIARQNGKPFVLGEFGYHDRSVYAEWLQVAEDEDVAGTLMWQIVPASRGRENDMTIVYPDDTALVDVFTQHAQRMNAK